MPKHEEFEYMISSVIANAAQFIAQVFIDGADAYTTVIPEESEEGKVVGRVLVVGRVRAYKSSCFFTAYISVDKDGLPVVDRFAFDGSASMPEMEFDLSQPILPSGKGLDAYADWQRIKLFAITEVTSHYDMLFKVLNDEPFIKIINGPIYVDHLSEGESITLGIPIAIGNGNILVLLQEGDHGLYVDMVAVSDVKEKRSVTLLRQQGALHESDLSDLQV